MYSAAIRERALDGIRTHGTLRAYLADFRACSKVFEMFVAERMAIERGVQFWLWEDVPHEIKTARGLARRDLGIDVTDGATTIVQCKLRARYITWRECSTFFGCALGYTDGAYAVPWRHLVLARNACSKLSPNLTALNFGPFDAPIGMDEFGAFVAATLLPLDGAEPPEQASAVAATLLPLDGAEPPEQASASAASAMVAPASTNRSGPRILRKAKRAKRAVRISDTDRRRKIVITDKCTVTLAKWRDKGELFRVDRYTRIAGRCLWQVMSSKTKIRRTKTARREETYNLSDLKHDLRCGFVELGDAAEP